jgi:hypothetical protein
VQEHFKKYFNCGGGNQRPADYMYVGGVMVSVLIALRQVQ